MLYKPNQVEAKPHKKARLVIPAPTASDQRWAIKYYAWDPTQEKLIRLRELACNAISDLSQRKLYCEKRIKEINDQLASGAYYDPVRATKQKEELTLKENPNTITLIKALDLAIDSRTSGIKPIRERSLNTIIQRKNKLQKWLDSAGLSSLPPRDFTEDLFIDFLRHLKEEDDLQARTLNNYISDIKTLFNYMRKHKARLVEVNPLELVERLETKIGRNIAYHPPEERALIDLCLSHEKYRKYHLLAMVMYNTMLRTNEISHLKRSNIHNPRPGFIYLNGDFVKNKYDRIIEITPELDKVFKDFGVYDLPHDYYLFSKKVLPGPTYHDSDFLGMNYRDVILNKLKMPPDYTLYSWRHTAVVKAKLLGIPDARIMIQGGWRDLGSYQKYLKSLGFMDNSDFTAAFPKMGS